MIFIYVSECELDFEIALAAIKLEEEVNDSEEELEVPLKLPDRDDRLVLALR